MNDEKKWIYWFDEVGQEQNDLVGKKCANLGEMTRIGMPIPPGFCLSIEAWYMFMEKTGLRQDITKFLDKSGTQPSRFEQQDEASKTIRQIIENKDFPLDMQQTIKSYYDRICQKYGDNAAVSVRSSGPKSHPGQYETYLNVTGDELINKIVKVWSSIFNTRSIAAVIHQGLQILESPSIGIAILKMVNVRSAGVAFSVHPGTGDPSKIFIEGTWGLGEGVVSGVANPDRYTIDKNTLEILEKVVGEKSIWIVPKAQGIAQESTPIEKRQALSSSDEELKKIAELTKKLETYFGKPQDVEWAIDCSLPFPKNVFLVQTRPIAAITQNKDAIDRILDMMLG